ncbi:MAG TPA: SRPBCC domain-containing protein [Kofleriaceae bacterium]|jgi:uncharacterized protein YndB with AHSA1/START domain
MQTNTMTAKTQITIHAAPDKVWAALTKPELVKQYFMGAQMTADWKVGGELKYEGEFQGKPFEEHGEIKKLEPEKVLQATNFSAASGKPDAPENYALVTWELEKKGGDTLLSVSQDHIANDKGVTHAKEMWDFVLKGIKKVVEA